MKFHVFLKIKSWRSGQHALNLPGSEWLTNLLIIRKIYQIHLDSNRKFL